MALSCQWRSHPQDQVRTKPPTHGFMEYDAVIADRLEPTIAETCQAVGKRPDLSRVSTSLLRPGPEFPDYRRVRIVGGRQGDPLGEGRGVTLRNLFRTACFISH
jgi:hypothetical protein